MTPGDISHPSDDVVLRLRKRADLQAVAVTYRGLRCWHVRDPVSRRYFQLQDEEYFLLNQLDGTATVRRLRSEFEARFSPSRLSTRLLSGFLSLLHGDGLIVSDTPGQGRQLLRRRDERQQRSLRGAIGNVLAIRLPGVDPHRFLDAVYPLCRGVFRPWFGAVCLCLVAFAMMLIASRYDEVVRRLPELDAFLQVGNLGLLAVVLACVKIIHELGHALACHHYGGRCHEIGPMLLVFTPCLYTDVSDAWMLPNRWHRIAISGAGIAVELVLASLCAMIWWFTHPGLLNSLALNAVFVCSVGTIFFNGNPLLRYDGYYILSDLLEVPNLRQQADAVFGDSLARWFTGHSDANERLLPASGHRLLASYAMLSAVYRLFVVVAILWFCVQALRPYRLQILVLIPATLTVLAMAVPVIRRSARVVQSSVSNRHADSRRMLMRGGAVALVVAVAMLIPLPYHIDVPVVIEPADAARVYVEHAGTLVSAVAPGTRVEPGDNLARLEDARLERSLAAAQADVAYHEARVKNLDALRSRDPETIATEIPTARRRLQDVRERLGTLEREHDRLAVTSPVAGTVIAPRSVPGTPSSNRLEKWHGTPLEPGNRGCFLDYGTLACLVGDPDTQEAGGVADQTLVDFLREGQRVTLQLPQIPGRVLTGRVEEIAERSLDSLPRELALNDRVVSDRTGDGAAKPRSSSYHVRIAISDTDTKLLPWADGTAVVHAESQSLARRLVRYLRRTFRFEL